MVLWVVLLSWDVGKSVGVVGLSLAVLVDLLVVVVVVAAAVLVLFGCC